MKTTLAAVGLATFVLLTRVTDSAEFELSVDALVNCFDIRKRSIQEFASQHIGNGKYMVDVKSDAHYCGWVSPCPIPKVIIFVTTHNNPEGWVYVVEEGHPIAIDVSGIGKNNIVYAFYTDITCGDNTGGSVLYFTTVTL